MRRCVNYNVDFGVFSQVEVYWNFNDEVAWQHKHFVKVKRKLSEKWFQLFMERFNKELSFVISPRNSPINPAKSKVIFVL